MDGVLGVEEVMYFVNDVKDAKQWYIELLGKEPYFDNKYYCAFHLANITVGIHPISDTTLSLTESAFPSLT